MNIPVMTCFDNNYSIPAGVAFYSLLENASKDYFYKIYVLHTDITPKNQEKLIKTVNNFKNASLEFINMQNKFENLFLKTKSKGHYSKEIYYKFLAPSVFEQYDKIIITDVDVVFLDDISKDFLNFNTNEDIYLAGVNVPRLKNGFIDNYIKNNYKNFSKNELEKLQTGAGYWIFNLKKMRQDNCQEKFIDCANKNKDRIIQPEQDCVNLVCSPKIKLLHPRAMVCSYLYKFYKNEDDFNNDLIYDAKTLHETLDKPIQLHYATKDKPWFGDDLKSEFWWNYFCKTPFRADLYWLIKKQIIQNLKLKIKLFNVTLLKIKNKRIYIFGFIKIPFAKIKEYK